MSTINFDNFKCRCSAISIMLSDSRSNPQITEGQLKRLEDYEKRDKLTEVQKVDMADLIQKRENGKKTILGDTIVAYLMEYYSWATAQKKSVSKEAMYIQFVEKGKDVEEESITLLSIIDGIIYSKNEERVENEYLSGIPDLFVGDNIMSATRISDIKSAWDYPGYLKKINTPVSKVNDLQIKGYMDITGATEGEVCDCLVNTPLRIVKDIHDSLLRRMNVISSESPEFINEYEILERSMLFDDIPHRQRVFRKKVEPFNEFDRNKLYDRVKIGREWLNNFHEMFVRLNN